MTTERQKGFEYNHLECPQSWVNAILQQYGIFYWELVATQTVVSKESHLEDGGLFDSDTIYSVTTTERFATIDLRRDLNRADIDRIKAVENRYFGICNELVQLGCSPVDDYGPPKEKQPDLLSLLLKSYFTILFDVFSLGRYSKRVKAARERKLAEYRETKGKLDKLILDNKQLLNV